MKNFDEYSATADELWEYCMLEYQSTNPFTKKLIANYYDKIKKIISDFDSGFRILEVGCGAGESSRKIFDMLKGQYFEISEYDERYVKKILELNLPYKVSQEDVFNLHRIDNEFDCVILLEVLEHLTDYEAALKELFRVASGYVLISVPNEPLWRILNIFRLKYLKYLGNTPGHINHWSPAKLKKVLNNFGKVVKIETSIPWIICLTKVLKN
jgi:2-polyprenyl-3-methyl-5-hydroxy-6-metoxy-1,4-benzoquinol methylase